MGSLWKDQIGTITGDMLNAREPSNYCEDSLNSCYESDFFTTKLAKLRPETDHLKMNATGFD